MSDKKHLSLADLAAQFPEYDLDIIAGRVEQIEPVRRFSQRSEALRLQPVIERLIEFNPNLKSAQIVLALKDSNRAVGGILGPTFDREVGKLVNAAKSAKPKGEGKAKKQRHNKVPLAAPMYDKRLASSGIPLGRGSSTAPLPVTVREATSPTSSDVGDHRPYQFTGKFAGMVFQSTAPLRNFYSAIQRHAPMSEIYKLAETVLADSASINAVVSLKPADRAIYDAVYNAILDGQSS